MVGSTIASFISISGGASSEFMVLLYILVLQFVFIRRQNFIPKIPHDIIIGSGVAAAISAGFGAPLAGIIFAHETVLRRFSMGSGCSCNFFYSVIVLQQIGIVSPLFTFRSSIEMSDILISLAIIGPFAAIVAIFFMKLILC